MRSAPALLTNPRAHRGRKPFLSGQPREEGVWSGEERLKGPHLTVPQRSRGLQVQKYPSQESGSSGGAGKMGAEPWPHQALASCSGKAPVALVEGTV